MTTDRSDDYKISFMDISQKFDISSRIKESHLYIKTGTETYYTTNNFLDCEEKELGNHSIDEICTEKEEQVENLRDVWEETDYNSLSLKENEPVYLKLTAKKDAQATIDWIPTFYGQEIKEMAERYNSPYILTSAKTGANVVDAFMYLAYRVILLNSNL